jgi:hypothetical protein
MAELDHLAGLDELCGIEHALRFHVIARAALVAGAPFRRAALTVGRRDPGRRLGAGGDRAEHECCCGNRQADDSHCFLPYDFADGSDLGELFLIFPRPRPHGV